MELGGKNACEIKDSTESFNTCQKPLDPPLEEGMATHSRILAWRIPWTEEPGRHQSMGSQRVRHNLVTEQQQIIIIYTSKWNRLGLLNLHESPQAKMKIQIQQV